MNYPDDVEIYEGPERRGPMDWLAARLQEPSTYVGTAVSVASILDFFQHGLPTNWIGWVQLVGMAVGGAVAAVRKDPGSVK